MKVLLSETDLRDINDTNRHELAGYMTYLLSSFSIRVTFTKKDGSTRVMDCTRSRNLIPEDKIPKGESLVQINPVEAVLGKQDLPQDIMVQRVFDTDKQAWRSFSLASIQKVEYDGAE